ncbi:unnamed protein product [Bursaphelenchus xylophilus]|nr:unnamed protein product [Bursaphelenchus xylophilus]CAG9111206.1 unnamed protein product [Bursaphelenchus xylophilus]
MGKTPQTTPSTSSAQASPSPMDRPVKIADKKGRNLGPSDFPHLLDLGTDVSAKFKGAFCEARVMEVETESVEIRITLKEQPFVEYMVTPKLIRGKVAVNETVQLYFEGRLVEAIIQHVKDLSRYKVVFNDGDEKSLRRSQMVLKGAKHFDSQINLDNLPLDNPDRNSSADNLDLFLGTSRSITRQLKAIYQGVDPDMADSPKSSNRHNNQSDQSSLQGSDTDADTNTSSNVSRPKKKKIKRQKSVQNSRNSVPRKRRKNDSSEESETSEAESVTKTPKKKPKSSVKLSKYESEDSSTPAREIKKEKKKSHKHSELGEGVLVVGKVKMERRTAAFFGIITSPSAYIEAEQESRALETNEFPIRILPDGKLGVFRQSQLEPFNADRIPVDQLGTKLKRSFELAVKYSKMGQLPEDWSEEWIFGPSSKSRKVVRKRKLSEQGSSTSIPTDPAPSTSTATPVNRRKELRDQFYARLQKHYDRSGQKLTIQPVVNGETIDLFQLFRCVRKRGGLKEMSKTLWIHCLDSMNLKGIVPEQIKDLYTKYLESFESWVRHKKDPIWTGEKEKKKEKQRTSSVSSTSKAPTSTSLSPAKKSSTSSKLSTPASDKPAKKLPKPDKLEKKSSTPAINNSSSQSRIKSPTDLDEDDGHVPADIFSQLVETRHVRAAHYSRFYSARVVDARRVPTDVILRVLTKIVAHTKDQPVVLITNPLHVEALEELGRITMVFVHYCGWNNRYDEWVTLDRLKVTPETRKQSMLALMRNYNFPITVLEAVHDFYATRRITKAAYNARCRKEKSGGHTSSDEEDTTMILTAAKKKKITPVAINHEALKPELRAFLYEDEGYGIPEVKPEKVEKDAFDDIPNSELAAANAIVSESEAHRETPKRPGVKKEKDNERKIKEKKADEVAEKEKEREKVDKEKIEKPKKEKESAEGPKEKIEKPSSPNKEKDKERKKEKEKEKERKEKKEEKEKKKEERTKEKEEEKKKEKEERKREEKEKKKEEKEKKKAEEQKKMEEKVEELKEVEVKPEESENKGEPEEKKEETRPEDPLSALNDTINLVAHQIDFPKSSTSSPARTVKPLELSAEEKFDEIPPPQFSPTPQSASSTHENAFNLLDSPQEPVRSEDEKMEKKKEEVQKVEQKEQSKAKKAFEATKRDLMIPLSLDMNVKSPTPPLPSHASRESTITNNSTFVGLQSTVQTDDLLGPEVLRQFEVERNHLPADPPQPQKNRKKEDDTQITGRDIQQMLMNLGLIAPSTSQPILSTKVQQDLDNSFNARRNNIELLSRQLDETKQQELQLQTDLLRHQLLSNQLQFQLNRPSHMEGLLLPEHVQIFQQALILAQRRRQELERQLEFERVQNFPVQGASTSLLQQTHLTIAQLAAQRRQQLEMSAQNLLANSLPSRQHQMFTSTAGSSLTSTVNDINFGGDSSNSRQSQQSFADRIPASNAGNNSATNFGLNSQINASVSQLQQLTQLVQGQTQNSSILPLLNSLQLANTDQIRMSLTLIEQQYGTDIAQAVQSEFESRLLNQLLISLQQTTPAPTPPQPTSQPAFSQQNAWNFSSSANAQTILSMDTLATSLTPSTDRTATPRDPCDIPSTSSAIFPQFSATSQPSQVRAEVRLERVPEIARATVTLDEHVHQEYDAPVQSQPCEDCGSAAPIFSKTPINTLPPHLRSEILDFCAKKEHLGKERRGRPQQDVSGMSRNAQKHAVEKRKLEDQMKDLREGNGNHILPVDPRFQEVKRAFEVPTMSDVMNSIGLDVFNHQRTPETDAYQRNAEEELRSKSKEQIESDVRKLLELNNLLKPEPKKENGGTPYEEEKRKNERQLEILRNTVLGMADLVEKEKIKTGLAGFSIETTPEIDGLIQRTQNELAKEREAFRQTELARQKLANDVGREQQNKVNGIVKGRKLY